MTMTTEELKHEMCEQLAAIRKARKHPVMTRNFEDDLEAYLEALRQDQAALVESLQHNVALYQDAYEQQKTLTRNALVYNREHYDELYQLRNELESVKSDREEGHDKLQEATAKLAQQTQTIIALHRVIKDQQTAQASLQSRIAAFITKRNREQAEAHRQIMQAEAISDERWELLEEKQKLIVSQRKRIESLENDLLLSPNPAKRRCFWRFVTWKQKQAQPLPKKTN